MSKAAREMMNRRAAGGMPAVADAPRKISLYRHLGILAAAGLVAGVPAVAGTLTGTLQSQIQLTAGCVIAGSSGNSAAVDFGMLDFGTRPSTFTGLVTASATDGEGVSGLTQIVCSPDVLGISVQVGPGAHPGQGVGIGTGARAMRNGSTAAYIPYEVYRDSGYSQAYPTGSAITGITIPTSGVAFTLPIYGRINKVDPGALPAGLYTDTLQVTLSY